MLGVIGYLFLPSSSFSVYVNRDEETNSLFERCVKLGAISDDVELVEEFIRMTAPQFKRMRLAPVVSVFRDPKETFMITMDFGNKSFFGKLQTPPPLPNAKHVALFLLGRETEIPDDLREQTEKVFAWSSKIIFSFNPKRITVMAP